MNESVVPTSSSRPSPSPASPALPTSFDALGLSGPLLAAVAAEGYTVPTPIQAKAIPHVLAGRDLFGCAQTGTGKTAAFALPILERLAHQPRGRQPKSCRVLVLAPTRELAGQINDSFRAYGRKTPLATALVYGGVGQSPQAAALRPGVDVLVATPGRLLDLLGQRLVDLRAVEVLVLDEADRMLDMGFIHDVRRIVGLLPRERQTLLFSATLPEEVRQLAADLLRTPLEVRTAPQATPADTVAQSVCFVARGEKRKLLVEFLRRGGAGRVIVFTRTKRGADRLHRELDRSGIVAAAIHGDKSQQQRERALAAFKGPRPPVLIATDIAARGIDVDQVSHVVNYELPHEPETYVHRIGRTGRAGHTGAAVSFCDHEERPRLAAIEKLLRRSLPPCGDLPSAVFPEMADPVAAVGPSRTARRSDGGSRGPRGGRAGGKPRSGERGRRGGRGAGSGGGARPRPTVATAPAGSPSGDSPVAAGAAPGAAGIAPVTAPAARPGSRRHRRAL